MWHFWVFLDVFWREQVQHLGIAILMLRWPVSASSYTRLSPNSLEILSKHSTFSSLDFLSIQLSLLSSAETEDTILWVAGTYTSLQVNLASCQVRQKGSGKFPRPPRRLGPVLDPAAIVEEIFCCIIYSNSTAKLSEFGLRQSVILCNDFSTNLLTTGIPWMDGCIQYSLWAFYYLYSRNCS